MDTYQKPTLVRLGTFREVTRTKFYGSGDFFWFRKKSGKPSTS